MNLKRFLIPVLAGGIGGFLAGVMILPVFVKNNFLGTAAIFNKLPPREPAVVTKIEERPVFIPKPDYFSDAIARIEPKVVAIQSFSGGTMIRSGSGVVLTQEGLIATLNSLVPVQAVQVVNEEKFFSGKVILRNYNQNIAIVSVGGSNWQAAELKTETPPLGQNLLAFAKTVNFGNDDPLIAEVLVSQVNAVNGQLKINVVYDPLLFGSAIFDNTGSILGLLDFRYQKPLVIGTKLLEETLLKALATME